MKNVRVVIDTNVVFSALRSRNGASYRLMSRLDKINVQIAVSVPLVIEYEKTAQEQLDVIPFSKDEISEYLDYLCSIAIRQRIFYLWRPYLRDAKDDMVLELAVASGSRYIVTYNKKDFGGVDKFNILAVNAKEFLHILGDI